jgi:hypothetical protein
LELYVTCSSKRPSRFSHAHAGLKSWPALAGIHEGRNIAIEFDRNIFCTS